MALDVLVVRHTPTAQAGKMGTCDVEGRGEGRRRTARWKAQKTVYRVRVGLHLHSYVSLHQLLVYLVQRERVGPQWNVLGPSLVWSPCELRQLQLLLGPHMTRSSG
jgi:hypothetical protein